jgi:cytochrome c5
MSIAAKPVLVVAALFCVSFTFAQQNESTQKNGAQTKQNAATKQSAAPPEGERLFQVNCQRCHHPPDSLSPKIAGSVLRHMRVRAMLSAEEEQAILKYLAP